MSWSGNNNNRKRNRDRRRPSNNNNNRDRRRNRNSDWGRSSNSGWNDFDNNSNWNEYRDRDNSNWNRNSNWNQFNNDFDNSSYQNFNKGPKKIYTNNEEPSGNLRRRFHRKQVEDYDQGYYGNDDRGNNWNAPNDMNQIPYDDLSYEQGFNSGRKNKRRKRSENPDNFEDYNGGNYGGGYYENQPTDGYYEYNEPKADHYDDGFMQVHDSNMGRGFQFSDPDPNQVEEVEEFQHKNKPDHEVLEKKDPALYGITLEESNDMYGKYREIERSLYTKHRYISASRDVQRHSRNTITHVQLLLKKVSHIISVDPTAQNDETLYTKEKVRQEKLDKAKEMKEKNSAEKEVKTDESNQEQNGEEVKIDEPQEQNGEETKIDEPQEQIDPILEAEDTTKKDSDPIQKLYEIAAEESKKQEVEKVIPVQVLLGVIKCGQYECRLMLSSQYHTDLVVVCKEMPTKSLLQRVYDLMILVMTYDKYLRTKKFIPSLNETDETIVIKKRDANEVGFNLTIRFTFICANPDIKITEDNLTLSKCVRAKRSIRHIRWFVNKVKDVVELLVMRIFIDLSVYNKEWSSLSLDIIQVLVHNAHAGSSYVPENMQIGGTEAHLQKANGVFKRCLEVLSSGILLPGGYGIPDPCSKNGDLSDQLSVKDAESITMAAQRCLRLICCGKIKRVLSLPIDK